MPGSAIDLQSTFGAALVGLLVSSMFAGLAIVQTWSYYWCYWNKDKKPLKSLVGFLLVMNILDTIIRAYAIYWFLVLNFGDFSALGYNLWAMNLPVVFCTLPNSAVVLYYARRIYLLRRSVIFPVIIVVLLVFGNILGIYSTVQVFSKKELSSIHFPRSLEFMELGTAVFGDIMISAIMCWSLYRKKTGFARTDSIIMALMAYSMNSGLVTSCLGTATFISVAVAPNSMIGSAFSWVLCKCYLNSFLALLNSRDYIRERSTVDNRDNAYNLSTIRLDPSSSKHHGVSVRVHRSTTSDFERGKPGLKAGSILEVPKEG